MEVVTLAERHRRKMEHLRAALEEIDALLTAYARRHGGRFIRYGSTAKGRVMAHSDVDIIADFPDHAGAAASYAEELCIERKLKPDVMASGYVSERFIALVAQDGITLA